MKKPHAVLSKNKSTFGLISLLLMTTMVMAQNQTVGLMVNHPDASEGYTLIAKNGVTYLVDMSGQVVHSWNNDANTTHPGYLLDNGDLLVVNRGFRRITWEGDLVWRYNNQAAHHDVEILPNGNVLVLVSGEKTADEAIAAGRMPALVTAEGLEPMVVYEINPQREIVWQWHVWDHLIQDQYPNLDNFGDVAAHPELVDINFTRNTSVDWLHGNSIDYNPELDQILLSPRFNNEIWVIDHSTSTAEAAGHTGGLAGKGGDLLFRWGNPMAYAMGLEEDQQLYGSHDAQWIEPGLPGAGNIMVFNNGGTSYFRDGNYSTIDEMVPQMNGFNYELTAAQIYAPEAPTWTYQADPREDFYSSFISGVQRLPNGNTFINEGENGRLFEVSALGELVWQYQNPITGAEILTQGDTLPNAPQSSVFRAYKYPKDYPGLAGRDLTPSGTIEGYQSYSELTIESPSSGLVTYPGEGLFSFGVGQLLTLSTTNSPTTEFVNWSVVSGSAILDDPNELKTTFTVTADNTTIRANFILREDLIFGDSFEF